LRRSIDLDDVDDVIDNDEEDDVGSFREDDELPLA
jgi:hypothetical protein